MESNRFDIPGAPKKYPLKNLANFSRTREDNKFLDTGRSFNCPQSWKVSLHYLLYWQYYSDFCHGNL